MKRRKRNLNILKGCLVLGLIFFMLLMFVDLLFYNDNITYDIFGNECRGKYIKVCGGKIHE